MSFDIFDALRRYEPDWAPLLQPTLPYLTLLTTMPNWRLTVQPSRMGSEMDVYGDRIPYSINQPAALALRRAVCG